MRINPISMVQNYNLKSKNNNSNINFGRFENEKTRKLALKTVMACEYPDDELEVQWHKEMIDWYTETPYVTIKHAKAKDGKDIIYAVMEKNETDRSEHKRLFDRVRKMYQEQFDYRNNRLAKQAGVIDSEPNYLTTLGTYSRAQSLAQEMQQTEVGYDPSAQPFTPSPQLEYKEDDIWRVFDLYGYR